jgi:hypothetical protein
MTNDSDLERFELMRTAEMLQLLAPDIRALLDTTDLIEGLLLPRYAQADRETDEQVLPIPIRREAPEA